MLHSFLWESRNRRDIVHQINQIMHAWKPNHQRANSKPNGVQQAISQKSNHQETYHIQHCQRHLHPSNHNVQKQDEGQDNTHQIGIVHHPKTNQELGIEWFEEQHIKLSAINKL